MACDYDQVLFVLLWHWNWGERECQKLGGVFVDVPGCMIVVSKRGWKWERAS
jgi:hypothetical protein